MNLFEYMTMVLLAGWNELVVWLVDEDD